MTVPFSRASGTTPFSGASGTTPFSGASGATHAAHLDHARKVADAILYEGYLLYPYYQASQKNRSRFQFGVLMPAAYAEVDPTEPSASQTQCLVECSNESNVTVGVRFLQLQRRGSGIEGNSWDEAVEREKHINVGVAELVAGEFSAPFSFGPEETTSDVIDSAGQLTAQCLSGAPPARLTTSLTAINGVVRVSGERVAGPYGALRLTVRIENLTTPDRPLRTRDDGLAYALIAAHALIGVPGGAFISMTDPPEWAAEEVATCQNVGTWPVLAGPQECRDLVLSSPVILYDHAEVAPESSGDLFDATEIDEILTLRTLALTDAEKQAARATDPRARELIDRLEGMPPEMFDRLHGAIRYLNATRPGTSIAPSPAVPEARQASTVPEARQASTVPEARQASTVPEARQASTVPWWDPGSDSSVSPETDHVIVNGVAVARGSKVIMRPGTRRADAQDLFLAGRTATVEAVLYDVDDVVHVAVTPDDDPAADLQRSHGRFLYFATDEIKPIEYPTHDETGREDSL